MNGQAAGRSGFVVEPQGGRSLWHGDTLMVFKATAEDTGGSLALWEQQLPHGSSPPLHTHEEDEAWCVLDGELTFVCGDQRLRASTGCFVFGPRGVPHSFRVESPTARMIGLTAPGGSEPFFFETGRPAEALTIPPAPDAPPDLDAMIAVAQQYGMQVVGPPLRGNDDSQDGF